MRLAWLSDLHLNFVRDDAGGFESEYTEFCQQVTQATPEAILISGDIAEAPDLPFYLDRLAVDLPAVTIYFVLGNHDFYRGSIQRQRNEIREFCQRRERLCYLTFADAPISLTGQTSLVGHDGWADGRLGAYDRSDVMLADFEYIEELAGLTKASRLERLQQLGDEAAEHLRRLLAQALATSAHVVVLTHVPPFWEACRHRGQVSSPEWVCHFACESTGDVLIEAALNHPQRQITVLCGHTHSPARYQPKPNLLVLAAKAEYGFPGLQQVLDLD